MRSRILGAPLVTILCVSLASGAALAQAPTAPVTPSAPAPAAPAATPAMLADTLTGDAKNEYNGGKLLYVDGDYAGALVKFQHAYQLASDPRLLWNMAACEKNLRHYTKVLTLVTKYQKDGGALLTEDDRRDALELIHAVEAFVSKLKITVNEPGAAVFVDDEQVGTTPLAEPVLVDMGVRRVRVKKDGFKGFDDPQPIRGGGEVNVSVTLEKEVHQGRLFVSAADKDIIAVDGKVVGTGHWDGVVASGGHTLRVTAEGMRSYQSELSIRDNEVRSVPVALDPEPKQGGGATWAWITGGTALIAGAAVGGYFLLKPKDQGAPPPVEGSLGSVPLPLRGSR